MAITLDASDFAVGGLLVASFARAGKLFTANSGLMLKSVGSPTPSATGRILDGVVALFQRPVS